MTWTYTNNPSNVQLDAVRLLIGDVDGDDPQLTDEEIAYYITTEGSSYRAAAAAARGLASLYARKVDKSVGDLSISYSQRQGHYTKLAADLDRRSSLKTAIPYLGGSSISDMDSEKDDTNRPKPSFERGQFDFPGTSSNSDTDQE